MTTGNGEKGFQNHVRLISRRMELKEGEEAVRRVLREIYLRGVIGTKDLARATRLPVPVTAAIRRELEKAGIVARRGGAVITERGKAYVEEVLGIKNEAVVSGLKAGFEIDVRHIHILDKLKGFSDMRPDPKTQLDQAFATPETTLRRALYMLDNGSLAGREALFLGDDDLTSVAAGLLGGANRLTVVDIDEKLLNAIREISKMERLGIECIHHDLRDPFPEGIEGRFDTFLTDPPYTLPGLRLFLSRGIQALRKRKSSKAYLAYPDKPPLEMLRTHSAIVNMGLYIDELIPRFNEYQGAEILANTTFLARLTVTEGAKPSVEGSFRGEIYTGELRPTIRTYKCRVCGIEIEVGTTRDHSTIEELKERGCPSCGALERFKLTRRRAV